MGIKAIWCWLFHRRHWRDRFSVYWGLPQFDDGERVRYRVCTKCHRDWLP